VNIDDVKAVIDSAKARGTESLEVFVRSHRPELSDEVVAARATQALQLIEDIPRLLDGMRAAARGRDLESVVDPVLEHTTRYFLAPIDIIPEMTKGLAGLLDDAYLVYRTLQHLEGGPGTLLDVDFDAPVAFLRGLVGERIAATLDGAAVQTLEAVSERVTRAWAAMASEA
jgi:uncharacterized membrane protein YkvA (DUF1232 family)